MESVKYEYKDQCFKLQTMFCYSTDAHDMLYKSLRIHLLF